MRLGADSIADEEASVFFAHFVLAVFELFPQPHTFGTGSDVY